MAALRGMRRTTDLDVSVADGVPEAIESIAYDATVLARRPVERLRTARGTNEIHPRPNSDGIPLAIRHEDDDVCCGLWCNA